MDRIRTGKPVAVGDSGSVIATDSYPARLGRPTALAAATRTPATALEIGDTPTGFFARLEPCRLLRPGDRLAPLNAALMTLLDEEYDAGFGPQQAAPDVRDHLARRVPRMARVVVIGGGFGGLASAARLAKLGHDVVLVERLPEARRRPRHRGAGRFRLGQRSDHDPVARRGPRPLPQVRPPPGARGRPGPAGGDPRPPLRGRHLGHAARRVPGGPAAARSTSWAPGSARSGAPTSGRSRKSGTRSAATTSSGRGTRTSPTGTPTPCSSPARRWRSGSSGGSATGGCASWPRTRSTIDGHDPRNVPAWLGTTAYLEQNFGAWTVPGGMAALAEALASRMETRGVSVLTGDRGPRHRGPRRPGGRRRHHRGRARRGRRWSARSTRASCRPWRSTSSGRCRRSLPPSATSGSRARCPTWRRRPSGTVTRPWWCAPAAAAPDGRPRLDAASVAGCSSEDIVVALARKGVDVRRQVVSRVDRSPRDQVEHWNGSPLGRAVAGPRPPSSAGWGPARRSRGCTPPGRTRRPARACRSSGSPRRWSRRRSARPELDGPELGARCDAG